MIRRILQYSSATARRLLVIELTLIVITALLQGIVFVLLVPLLRALFADDLAAAGTWLATMAGVGVAYAVLCWFSSQTGLRASTAVLSSLLDRLGDRLVQLPLSWFGTDRAGLIAEIATRGAMFVSSSPYAIVRQILTGFLTPATVLFGMYLFDWRLALAMTATVPVMWFTFRWLRRTMERDDAAHSEAVAEASGRIIECAQAQPALRTAGRGSVAETLVEEALSRQHRAYRGLLLTGGAGIATFAGVVQLALTVVLVLGAYLAIDGSLDPATLIALLVLGVRFSEPISNSGALGGGVAAVTTTLNQLDDIEAAPALPEPTAPAAPAHWGIEFEDVTFGYGGAPVLEQLSLTAPPGQMTAIVGPSGSGKTTIVRLMARLYDPESGTVRLGGCPLAEVGTDAVEAAVAPVFQDVYLFDDTILNNIWLGNPELSRADVIEAATRARVDEIVARLPAGWETRVGEAGSNLSGGERQRVSIARALLKDAPIVLLDEATAALDIGNEIAIGEALDALRSNRTMIVVAHRLQTIMTADQILMLRADGSIAERGTHADLLAAGGGYAHYWRDRTGATGWQLGTADSAPASPERHL